MKIPFNKPWASEKSIEYIQKAISSGHLSGNGRFTFKCHNFFKQRYNLQSCLLTTSCTDALEMAALLLNIKYGDEVIVPSFTFVSTALAFHRQGAVIRFVDSRKDHPGMDEKLIEPLINERTRAIIPVHYSGVACDMDLIMKIAEKYGLFVVEDAAHAIESTYKGKQLGTIGHLGCFSFHETKNIHCGEGGMLAVNDIEYAERAEILWEKGTNRAQFFRGEVSFYEWKDTGSSFLPSEINAAFLYAQLQEIEKIQNQRLMLWHHYYKCFQQLHNAGYVRLPVLPEYSTLNGNSFFLICRNKTDRDGLIAFLKQYGIMVLSHYIPLHKSKYYSKRHDGRTLPMSEKYSDTIIRFPVYHELTEENVDEIVDRTVKFFMR